MKKPLPKKIRRKLETVTGKILDVQEYLCSSGRTHVADELDKARKEVQRINYALHEVKS